MKSRKIKASKTILKFLKRIASRGGKLRAKKLNAKQRSAIARKGGLAKRKKRK